MQLRLSGISTINRWKEKAQCPGFGKDRVNFHRTPGRGTAGGWGLTPPGRTELGVPYPVTSRWVPVGGARRREGTRGLGGRSAGPVSGERLSGLHCSLLCFLLICIVGVPVFPLFAVLLNCPYPDPPVSACFFPFSSAPRRGEGRLRGAFVASCSQNKNTHLAVILRPSHLYKEMERSSSLVFKPTSRCTVLVPMWLTAKCLWITIRKHRIDGVRGWDDTQ